MADHDGWTPLMVRRILHACIRSMPIEKQLNPFRLLLFDRVVFFILSGGRGDRAYIPIHRKRHYGRWRKS